LLPEYFFLSSVSKVACPLSVNKSLARAGYFKFRN